MSKFNIATEYFRAIYKSIAAQVDKEAKDGNFMALLDASSEAAIDFVRGKMKLLNPNKFSL